MSRRRMKMDQKLVEAVVLQQEADQGALKDERNHVVP